MQKHTQVMVGAFVALVALGLGAPTSLEAQQIYEVSQLTQKPNIASPMAAQRAIQKAYPASLQSRGVQGKVVLQFVVTPAGKVDASTIVIQSAEHQSLGDAARDAVAGIDFVPGEVDGAAVSTRVVFPISFVSN